MTISDHQNAMHLYRAISHLIKLRQHWFNLTNDKRVESLQIAADNLNEIADRQRPPGQRRRKHQSDSFENLILLWVLALIASALAYAAGVDQGRAGRPVGTAPTVVR
jgi:hypothetical protein